MKLLLKNLVYTFIYVDIIRQDPYNKYISVVCRIASDEKTITGKIAFHEISLKCYHS
jgi:hypothetical protein